MTSRSCFAEERMRDPASFHYAVTKCTTVLDLPTLKAPADKPNDDDSKARDMPRDEAKKWSQ